MNKETLSVKSEEKKFDKSFDSKLMLSTNAEKKTKIRYNDRLAVEIIEETQFYKKGQIISPAKVKGEALIAQKIAIKYTPKEGE